MDKTAIKNFAIEARKLLRESAIKKAGMYGITIDECSKPIQKGADFEVYKTIAGDEIRLYGKEAKMRSSLVNAIREKGFEQVIEETAYTWFNRLIAIRFMEVNDYLPTRVRVLSSETGNSTPDIVTHLLDVDLDFDASELDKIQKTKDDNRFDEAFQMLFIKQCNELNEILPGLFEKTNDYMELLLDISYTSDGVVRMLVDDVPENDFNVEREGQIEIIGWLYQYYNTELKDDTFAKLKKNIKITKERIPAATQLFTPDWIVRYMVENSLGRVWIDHLRAVDESRDEKALAESFGWKYYLPEAKQEENVAAELVKIRTERRDLKPQDISCIDPCCGSGHILVYMFDVLLQIYESEGISVRDAVFDILEKNIHGLDIDMRAYQLSYFALMMKGRGAAGRRFFRGVETEEGTNRPVELNVYAIDESNDIDRSSLQFLGNGMTEIEKNAAENQVNILLDEMMDAKEYGSIINVSKCDWELVDRYLSSIRADGQLTLGHVEAQKHVIYIKKLSDLGRLFSKKYSAVVTNPPYMGASGMSLKLSDYVKSKYPDTKSDLSTVFMEKTISLCSNQGYMAMINIPVWMFLSSYEKLRNQIIIHNTYINMLHFGRGVFGSDFGTTAFVVKKKHIPKYNATFRKLFEKQGAVDSLETKEKWFYEGVGRYVEKQENFIEIPGMPVAYSLGKNLLAAFESKKLVSTMGDVKQGLATGDNNRFLRLWFEVDNNKICVNAHNSDEAIASGCKWFPYNKGGAYRKWYGNVEYVVNWENDGYEIKNIRDDKGKLRSRPQNIQYFFKESLTWSKVTIGGFSMRYVPAGAIFDVAGCSLFPHKNYMSMLANMNSCVQRHILSVFSQSVNYEVGQIAALPMIDLGEKESLISELAQKCVDISKNDWDSFENSWEYKRHPFINGSNTIEESYDKWKAECNMRFDTLLEMEETINRELIEIYGLLDEVNPSVKDEEVSVRKADLKRDIKGFISYSVGCMFGRYSLDETGVVYAGGKFDISQYNTFLPDEDAIIPITDEEYFDDDIVTRFIEFIRIVYGEKSLEKNLDFIAKALDNKGNTSREVIRNYFLTDFFKDHCSLYSVTGSGNRPIYWLFDSGKQNGFKCLIYMHRYTPDTVGLIRSVYLKKVQDAIESSLKNAEYVISNSESAVDRADSTRKRDKYVKQLAEIKPYYQALSHVAMQRIEIDLDDGVKVNYAKFQNVEVGGEGEKKQTINLLAKI